MGVLSVGRFLKVIQSVLAALIGVQSDKRRREDFQNGKVTDFIIGGICMVIILIALNALLVSYVLS